METNPRNPDEATTWLAALLVLLEPLGAEDVPVLVTLPELEVEVPPKFVVVTVG